MKTEAPLYTKEAKKISKMVSLPIDIFTSEWNKDLIQQVIVSLTSNQRQRTAHTKGRSEVRGGGKKPYRQKGTGRARHGSIRSPLWVGGGVTFGPTNEKDYSKKINKKMRAKALSAVLSKKLEEKTVACVEDMKLESPKTKIAAKILSTIKKDFGQKEQTNTLVVLPQKNIMQSKSWSNLHRLFLTDIDTLNALDVFRHTTIIFVSPEECMEKLSDRLSEKINKQTTPKEKKETKSTSIKKTAIKSKKIAKKKVVKKVSKKKVVKKAVKKVAKKQSKNK